MIKPPRLKFGDTIGIISPSWGGAEMFPHRVKQGVQCLRKLGFDVRLAKHALNRKGFVSDAPENRAQDIHEMFADPDVKAIIASIGGDHSCHLLPLLDFDLIRSNPKTFMGYSDITVLNVAIWQRTGLVTFNGGTLLADFAEYPDMFEYSKEYFLKAVMGETPIGRIEPASHWTDEFLDWGEKQDQTRPRNLLPSSGWTWLKEGSAEGRLVGGCLESLQHLRGTEYWADWQDAIFFFETSEDKPSPRTVDGTLMDYQNMGVFEKIRGLLIGRPMSYSDDEKQLLRDIVVERTRGYSFPVVADMDFGHTAPQFTLPLGVTARIDSTRKRFEIVEGTVK
ncbi:MAG TPA: LD-carboxypeptidase [Anaerolineales bacterium]|nr:LD-carboxypeptidase [Anaerolineae bacterium]HRJ56503.1 LD-carboxypeptidase [Anaerolineales bacterium]HRK87759.1 LD-carboxypeptidase [Anaerolineales bacterium]